MTRYHPARLAGGRLLLPLYNECLAIPVFIKSDDDFKTWEEVQLDMGTYFVEHIGQIQPSLIQRADGKVVAITRDGTENRRIGRQISKDKGDSWAKTELTELPNSGTGVEQVKLLDGHIVVAFNNNPYDRFPLNAALSLDEGQTYTAAHRTLNSECPSGSCSYGYTSITQSARDGTIWVTYTHNRETIGWVHFNEAWLMQGHEPLNNGDN
jgi:predicted neuraminidase